jgi:hypothetical protein
LIAETPGLRLLVASLWSAILAASVVGLFAPRAFAVVLLIQVFYKAVWLATFVAPRWQSGEPVPVGISLVFVAIVVTYPLLYWVGTRD